MKLYEFLRDLEAFYPLNESEEKVQKRISSYADILEGEIIKSRCDYDFAKLLRYIQTHYTYKQFPSVPYILELLPDFKVTNYQTPKNEGEVVLMTLPSGFKYDFVVTNFGNTISDLRKRYCKIEKFPKGTILLKDSEFTPEGGANDTTK